MSEKDKRELIFKYYGESDRNVLNTVIEKYANKKVYIFSDICDDNMEIKIYTLKGEEKCHV